MEPCFSTRAYNSTFRAGLEKIRTSKTRCWILDDSTYIVEIGGRSARFDTDGHQIPGNFPTQDRQEIYTIPINIIRNLSF